MADFSVVTEAGNFSLQFARMAAQMRCAMPGTIDSFDYNTQRATVIPGVKLKVVLGKEVKYVELPVIQQVPVVIPYGFAGKVVLTHPIEAGDPCMLIFADRAIENFLLTGKAEIPGSQLNEDTTSPRAHHLTDAVCIPGLVADPQLIPNWNAEHIELRDYDRKHFISLGTDGITISDSSAVWRMAEGRVTLDAPSGIAETANEASRSTSGNCSFSAGGSISSSASGNISSSANGKNSVTAGGVATLQGTNVAIGRGGSGGGENTFEGTLRSRSGTFIDCNGRDSSSHTHGGVKSGSDTSGPTNG